MVVLHGRYSPLPSPAPSSLEKAWNGRCLVNSVVRDQSISPQRYGCEPPLPWRGVGKSNREDCARQLQARPHARPPRQNCLARQNCLVILMAVGWCATVFKKVGGTGLQIHEFRTPILESKRGVRPPFSGRGPYKRERNRALNLVPAIAKLAAKQEQD